MKLYILIVLVLIIACSQSKETSEEDSEFMLSSSPSDVKQKACLSADKYNTCSKLDSLGIITQQECCSEMSKCC